jgi:hypothetical protein
VLVAADTLGAASRLLDLTTQYVVEVADLRSLP